MSQLTHLNPGSEFIFPCSECQAGHMQRRFVVYYTWLGNDLITVPDFPAWVCDVCGRREFDASAINQLSLLLSPNTGNSTSRKPRLRPVPQSKAKSPRPSQPE